MALPGQYQSPVFLYTLDYSFCHHTKDKYYETNTILASSTLVALVARVQLNVRHLSGPHTHECLKEGGFAPEVKDYLWAIRYL